MVKIVKDCVVLRFDSDLPSGMTIKTFSSNICEYLCKNYGECKVIHTWENDGQRYDSDGVPLHDRFAIVLKFVLSGTANQTKQKYNGRLLGGLYVATSWLESKDIVSLGMPESAIPRQVPKGSAAVQRYWKDKASWSMTTSSRAQSSPERSSRKPVKGQKPYHTRTDSPSSSVEWLSPTTGRSSPTYSLRSSRQRSPARSRQISGHTSSSDSSRSHSPSKSRRSSHTKSTRNSSPTSASSLRKSTGSWEGVAADEGEGEWERPSSRSSSGSTKSSLRTSSRLSAKNKPAEAESGKKGKEGSSQSGDKGKWISIGSASGAGEEKEEGKEGKGAEKGEKASESVGSRTRSKGQVPASIPMAPPPEDIIEKKIKTLDLGQVAATAPVDDVASQQSVTQKAAEPPVSQQEGQPVLQKAAQHASQRVTQPMAQQVQPATQPKHRQVQPVSQPKSRQVQPVSQPKPQQVQPKSQQVQPKSQQVQPKSQQVQPKPQQVQPVSQPKSRQVEATQPVSQRATQGPKLQEAAEPVSRPLSSKRPQGHSTNSGKSEVRAEKDTPASFPPSSSVTAKEMPVASQVKGRQSSQSITPILQIKREKNSPPSDTDVALTMAKGSDPKPIEIVPSNQPAAPGQSGPHHGSSKRSEGTQQTPPLSQYGEGSGTAQQTPPLSQLYGEGSGTSQQTPPLSQLYGEGNGTSQQTPPLSQLYGEGSGTSRQTPPLSYGETPPPSELFGEGSGTSQKTPPLPQLQASCGTSQVVSARRYNPSATEGHSSSQPPDGDGTHRYELIGARFAPERFESSLVDRDITPPAEILEISQQLAHGNYADWYQRFENDPHLLEQFKNYFNISTEAGEEKGLSATSDLYQHHAREEKGLSTTSDLYQHHAREEEKGLSTTSDPYRYRGDVSKVAEGLSSTSGPYQYHGDVPRGREGETYGRDGRISGEYPPFKTVPKSADYRPRDLPKQSESRRRISTRATHSASPSLQGSRLPGGNSGGAGGQDPLLPGISVGELKTILQRARTQHRGTPRDRDNSAPMATQEYLEQSGARSEVVVVDRSWKGDEVHHGARGRAGYHTQGGRDEGVTANWSRSGHQMQGDVPDNRSTHKAGVRDSHSLSSASGQREEYGPSLPPESILEQLADEESYLYTGRKGWGRGERGHPARGRGLGKVGGAGSDMELGGRASDDEWSGGEDRQFSAGRRGGDGQEEWLHAGVRGERMSSDRQMEVVGWSDDGRQGSTARRGDEIWQSKGWRGEGGQSVKVGMTRKGHEEWQGGERLRERDSVRQTDTGRRDSRAEWLDEGRRGGGTTRRRQEGHDWMRDGEEELLDEGTGMTRRRQEGHEWMRGGEQRRVEQLLDEGTQGGGTTRIREEGHVWMRGGEQRRMEERQGEGEREWLSREEGSRQGWLGESATTLDCEDMWSGEENGGTKRQMARDHDGVLVGVRGVEEGETAVEREDWTGGVRGEVGPTATELGSGVLSREDAQGPATKEGRRGGDGGRDTEDELYQSVEEVTGDGADMVDAAAGGTVVDAAVQTGTWGEEVAASPQQTTPWRKVLKKHTPFSEAALKEFTRRSRALIASVQVLISDDPSMEALLINSLTVSLKNLSTEVEGKMWEDIDNCVAMEASSTPPPEATPES